MKIVGSFSKEEAGVICEIINISSIGARMRDLRFEHSMQAAIESKMIEEAVDALLEDYNELHDNEM